MLQIEPQQIERLKDFIAMVTEWTAKFPLKAEASQEDKDAALTIYCCCEGAEENLYELQQIIAQAHAPATPATDDHDLAWWKREAFSLVTLLRAKCSDAEWANLQKLSEVAEAAPTADGCKDCDEAAKHAYSDATTPGFFSPKCSKHAAMPSPPAGQGSTTRLPCYVDENMKVIHRGGCGLCGGDDVTQGRVPPAGQGRG